MAFQIDFCVFYSFITRIKNLTVPINFYSHHLLFFCPRLCCRKLLQIESPLKF